MDWDAVKTSFADSGASCLAWREEGAPPRPSGASAPSCGLREQPDFIRGACVADKISKPKPAALLLAYGHGEYGSIRRNARRRGRRRLENRESPTPAACRVPSSATGKIPPAPWNNGYKKSSRRRSLCPLLSAAVFPGE